MPTRLPQAGFEDDHGRIMGENGFQWVFLWVSWDTMV
jgi:hypothetical protein